MNDKKKKKVRKEYKEYLKARPKTFIEGGFYANNIMLLIIVASVGVALGIIFVAITEKKYEVLLTFTPSIVSGLLLIFVISARTQEPQKNIDESEWRWIQGRKILFATSFAALLVYISLGLIDDHNQSTYILLSVSFLAYVIYSSIIYLIIQRPKYFLSSKLVGIGSGAFIGSSISVIIMFILLGYKFSLILVPILINAILSIRTSIFNPVQGHVIRMVKPNVLLHSLKTNSEIISSQIKALNLLKKSDYDTQIALLESLAKLHTPKNVTIWTVTGFILTFILGVIGESLIQDLFYDSFIKKFICDTINVICN